MDDDERREANWLRRRAQSFVHAGRGLRLLAIEPNARIHLAMTVVVLVVSFALGVTAVEWALIVFAVALVFSAEALNSALENLANAAVPARHPLVGAAKDLGAGAVLIAAGAAALIGVLVLGPRLLALV